MCVKMPNNNGSDNVPFIVKATPGKIMRSNPPVVEFSQSLNYWISGILIKANQLLINKIFTKKFTSNQNLEQTWRYMIGQAMAKLPNVRKNKANFGAYDTSQDIIILPKKKN